MKKYLQKFYNVGLRLIPVCACLMLTAVANSSASWINGQDELPVNAKKYRKF